MLKTVTPASKELQKYIELFYVFNTDKPSRFSYIAFPHTNTAISFFKGVTISRDQFHINIEQEKNSGDHYCIEMLGKYTKPVFVHYRGDFEEVAIVFKPLGVNRFIRGDLIDYASEYSQPLQDENWVIFSRKLFEKKENRLELLEEFLLSQLDETRDLTKMEEALRYFENPDLDHSVEAIAQQLGMTVKTFQRHFLKQVTCTPSEYKRIARFRNALQAKIMSKEIKSLTSISYDNNYADQSYFIREFKKLTNLNPKKFFKEITVLDDEKIIWEIK